MGPTKLLETAPIRANERLQGDYFRVEFRSPGVAAAAQPGQFVHLRFPVLAHRMLRRPFSICDACPETGIVSVVYKIVGEGTRHLADLGTDAVLDVLGPLGRGYTLPEAGETPVIVAGGYGCAATYMLVVRTAQPCHVLIGGRSRADLLMTEEFGRAGAEVTISTDDGSAGHHGLVTDLLVQALDANPDQPRVYACGPNPMLKAVSEIVLARGLDAEISLDHAMCCGVGACFACVVKRRATNEDGWEYVRTCTDGPVFRAGETVWE